MPEPVKPPTQGEAIAAASLAGAPVGQVVPPRPAETVAEIGGPSGPEPVRYGDWERRGRCIDF